MKRTNTPWLLAFLLLCMNMQTVFAQTKDDVTNGSAEITWLGMDFTQAKFIGEATQFKDAGQITNSEFRDKYINGWNQLYINEQKKYDVADVVHRSEVKYAIDVTGKVNDGIKTDFFSNSPDEYGKLDEQKVEGLVKKYDFQGKKGVGLMFFVDGLSKGKEEASAWVVYVNMNSKTVLLSAHKTGKTGGFGFKNFWAKAFLNILKSSDYKKWK